MLQNFDIRAYQVLDRTGRKCECNFEAEVSESKVFFWLVCDRFLFRAFVNTLLGVRVPKNTELCQWARTACSFRSTQAATLLEFMYHSRIVLSVVGSVWYMIRNLRCTVTIDSVLANSKTQNAFLFTVNAIFLHDYTLAVEP